MAMIATTAIATPDTIQRSLSIGAFLHRHKRYAVTDEYGPDRSALARDHAVQPGAQRGIALAHAHRDREAKAQRREALGPGDRRNRKRHRRDLREIAGAAYGYADRR